MLKILFNIIKKNKGAVIALALLTFVSAATSLITPYLSGTFIDILSGQEGTLSVEKCISGIIISGGVGIAVGYFYQLISSKLIVKSIFDYRQELLTHLRRIPFLEYKKFESAYLNERTRKDIGEIVNFVVSNHINFFLKGLMFVLYTVAIAYLNITLFICILVISPIYVLIYRHYRGRLYSTSMAAKETENRFFNIYNEQLEMMEEIRVDSKFGNHDSYVEKNFVDYFRAFAKNISVATLFNSVESIISLLFQAFLLSFGAYSILQGTLTIGNLTIISSYFGAVIGIINYYVSFGKGYQESRASFDRVQTIMAIEEEPKGEARSLKIDYILADLTFQYNNDSFVLKNEKIQVKKGEAFGIFGKNGSGKTTAVKLLIGLYPTSENGEVTFNGVDINKLDMEYMRGNKISYVMQNPKMTKKSVSGLFEEIDCEITYETVCQSFSFLSNSLRELVLKTIKEFWLKPFYSMSEGERQFITIIRALYKNPEILIMDEPSSSLDSLRQQWLLDLISEIKKDRMVIIISHDMALQDVCDKYIFLD